MCRRIFLPLLRCRFAKPWRRFSGRCFVKPSWRFSGRWTVLMGRGDAGDACSRTAVAALRFSGHCFVQLSDVLAAAALFPLGRGGTSF